MRSDSPMARYFEWSKFGSSGWPELYAEERSAGYGAPGGSVNGMRLGSRVRHAKFGEGVVLGIEGQGEHARVQVNFQGAGAKWLVLAYANLEKV